MPYNKFSFRRIVNTYARDIIEACGAEFAALPGRRAACYRVAAYNAAIDYGRFRPRLAQRFADAYVSAFVD